MKGDSISPSDVFASFPANIRQSLLKAFTEITTNYREHRWEPSELNGGKLCEVIYSIIHGYLIGNIPQKASKPPNIVDACRALESIGGKSAPRSIRIQIPRMIIALYEIRNNRGVGHIGGDVDPNYMDATAVLYISKWLVAELIRFFHDVDIQTAESLVNNIVERILPYIWEVGGKFRVLNTDMTMKNKMLLLLYYRSNPILESDLVDWLEHSNPSVFRRDVLRTAHKSKLIEYDINKRTALISPKGVLHVEEKVMNI